MDLYQDSWEQPREVVQFTKEEQFIHHLMLHANFMPNMGIMDGKMKVVLFFFDLYRKNKYSIYEDFAFELLEEIYENTDEETAVGFAHGICGIGWGIEKLIKEKILGVDEDVCSRFDERVYTYFMENSFKDIFIAEGLFGLLLYGVARLDSTWNITKDSSGMLYKHLMISILDKIVQMLTLEKRKMIVKEVDNENFQLDMLHFYSAWEYPVYLEIITGLADQDCFKLKAEKLLIFLLEPFLLSQNIPVKPINKQLLIGAIKGVERLNQLNLQAMLTPIIQNLSKAN